MNHERKHWDETAHGRVLACAYDNGAEWAARILLVPTLLAVYRGEEASAAISRIPAWPSCFLARRRGAALLRDLYPPDETTSLRWWSPLPLDRLGETLLAAVLTSFTEDEGRRRVCRGAAGAASLPEAIQGLIVMTRLSADPETTGPRGKTQPVPGLLAAADGSRLLPALLSRRPPGPAGFSARVNASWRAWSGPMIRTWSSY